MTQLSSQPTSEDTQLSANQQHNSEDVYVLPASFAQKRLWLLEQFEEKGGTYNMPMALLLTGDLDVAALERTLAEIIDRHESLRTNFQMVDDELMQVIAEKVDFQLPVRSLTQECHHKISTPSLAPLPPQIQDFIAEENQRPFNLEKDAPIRTQLLKVDDTRHILSITLHHIVADAWSQGVLNKELTQIYNAFAAGKASPLAPLSIQYADFALWQQEFLSGETLNTHVDYWRKQLSDAPPLLPLPTDRPRPAVQTFKGNSFKIRLTPALSKQIKSLSQRLGATPFMLLLAVFNILLSRYSGAEDIVVGSPIANRLRKELEPLIGCFVNTLAFRTQLNNNLTFSDVLSQVRQTALDAYTHQDLPFEKLIEELQPARSLSYSPLFQVMFVLQNAPTAGRQLSDLSVQQLPKANNASKFDLSLIMAEVASKESEQGKENQFAATFEYNVDLFDAATVERMATHFQTLLAAVVANPKQRISELEMLTASERHQLLFEWNNTATDALQPDVCVHTLFEQQALRSPNAIAVSTPTTRANSTASTQLTYQALNEKADRLASYLQAQGFSAGSLIGVCIERSFDMVIALLAILKAGHAYVPLDPDYPADRLSFMLSDAKVSLLLTQQSLLPIVQNFSVSTLCLDTDCLDTDCLDTDWAIGTHREKAPQVTQASADALAYVIYTSGSTGRPKGVKVSHRAMSNLVQSMTKRPGLGAEDTLLSITTLSFDIAVFEIFSPLIVGAQVVLVPQVIAADGVRLRPVLEQSGVTVMQATPATWQILLTAGWTGRSGLNTPTLRIVCGGEPMTVQLAQQLSQCSSRLWNQYGPTEATVYTTVSLVSDGSAEATNSISSPITIGTPIDNVQTYLLDKAQNPVPVGVPGELYVGGAGLAQGYLNQPELTAEKFVPHPFTPGERLYRTGDLAKYHPSGDIEHLGRLDYQIKLRGFRIELGEIEATLVSHPDISQAAVVAKEHESGDHRLVGYFVAKNHAAENHTDLNPQALADYLQQRLPQYMTPSSFVQLEAMPLTPNGKINRKALPAPDLSALLANRENVLPTTPTQQTVADIWQTVLSIETLSIHDDFFAIGGHSLLAAQVISRLRSHYAVDIDLRSLFESSTIVSLARVIDQLKEEHNPTTQSTSAITPVSRNQQLPLSSTQQRLWLLDKIESKTAAYNISNMLRLVGTLNVTALERSLSEIIKRHEVLRTTFSEVDGQPIQKIHPPQAVTLPVVALQNLPTTQRIETAKQRMQAIKHSSFDLEQGPLYKFELLQMRAASASDNAANTLGKSKEEPEEKSEYILAINIHHIVFDGWSFSLFFKELAVLYEAFCEGNTPRQNSLPVLPIQYADFAYWQQQGLRSQQFRAQLTYWKQHLADAPYVLELPADYARPAEQTYTGAAFVQQLPLSLKKEIQALNLQSGTTLFMTLLAAFKLLCYRLTNQSKIIIGSPIAGRNQLEVEQLMGFFASNLVLYTDLSSNPSGKELLEKVKQVSLEAYANQDVPFEALLEALQPPRDLSRTPLFQIWFNMLNLERDKADLKGIEASPVASGTVTSKFDLTLYVSETPQGIRVRWIYNTRLFQPETIEYFGQCYAQLLESLVENPDAKIETLNILPARATAGQAMLPTASAHDAFEPDISEIEQSIPARFTAQVRKHGDRIALKTPRHEWTYQTLNERANQIAATVVQQAQQTEQVALLFEHDAPMIAGMLGVLKSHKAYVALDPSYPQERLKYILQHSQASVVLADEQTVQYAQALADDCVSVINISNLPADTGSTLDFTGADISPDARAYILYTSGSTGKPKGVVQNHRNVQHFIKQQTQLLNIHPEDRLSLVASYSFDAAIVDIFSALLNGATLYPIAVKQLSPVEIGERIANSHISIYHSTPTLYRSLLAYYVQADEEQENISRLFTSIRAVVLGGEETVPADIYQYQSYFAADCQFVNLYGSTESTIGLQYVVPSNVDKELRSLPVGYPIINTDVLLLNEAGKEAQLIGEIAIRSAHLALCYWQQPERTQQAFLPDPDGGDNRRLYRTGDLGRRRADGSIEFLGRKDFQIKLRGFRIEPGEIESVLATHPHVENAVVIAREDNPGDQRLVAYLTTSNEAEHEPDDTQLSTVLRQWSEQKLPDYMVPAAFVVLPALPLTPSGKIDRLTLPAPDTSQRTIDTDLALPQTLTEQKLAQIWSEVLNVENVGIHDNFFELGGHSLLATQLFARIRSNFATNLSLRRLFESPTIAEIAPVIENAGQADLQTAIKPIDSRQFIPLSSTQKRLWILDQLESKGNAYSIKRSMRLIGALDVSVLERVLSEIVRRHEALRTTFEMTSTEPVQIINPPIAVTLLVADFCDLSADAKAQAIKEQVAASAAHQFDLQQGPLFYFSLSKISENEHVFLTNVHHIVFDGWSYRLLFKEISQLYAAYSRGLPSPLPELSIQYADFANWQQKWLKSDEYHTQLNYWKQQLAGAPYVLDLPTDYPRPVTQTFAGDVYIQRLSLPFKQQLLKFSQAEGATLFMTMLSAFKLLCYRFTNQERIIIGSPIAGRSHAELEQLMGFFVSNLVLHTDLSGEPSCRELLGRVKQTALDAYSNQDVPFEALLEELQPPRDISRTPLFQVWFNMVNLNESKLRLSELQIKPLKSSNKVSAKFDLTLYIRENARGMSIQWVYNTNLFKASTIEYMSTCFQAILEAMVSRPEQAISTVPLPTPQQSDQWITTSPVTTDYTPFDRADIEQSIPARFASQVQLHGERLAVKTPRYEWSYKALDYESDRIAAGVLSQLSEKNQQIALLFEHDAPMIAGILGVLKLGRAYVALDPSYPQERLRYILEDSQASVVVATAQTLELAHRLADEQTHIINVETLPNEFERPAITTSPDDLAYILYTSGSTGKPKGVMQNHRNVLHFIQVYANNLHISEQDKLTLLSSYSFDAAVMDIYGALMMGAALYPIDIKREGLDALSQQLHSEQITVYHSTPTLYRYFLEALPKAAVETTFPHVRLVVMGGEAVNKQDVELYKTHFPADAVFVNGLGPSESTVTLQQFIDKDIELPLNNVPVGYPVAETEVLLLNADGEESQIYGEIAIRSRHVALGYWQRHELNETAFIENADGSKKRTYRTGDLGRLRPDGSLEFLGRKDFQVKLRGFRIELGEIESVLAKYPTVSECVVIGREEQPGELYLAAYYVSSESEQESATETEIEAIREFIAQQLPDYMVPTAFVRLPEMPLTPSGKVDRKALTAPEMLKRGADADYVAPQTSAEKALANIWATVLKVEKVSIHDNFFLLGGHSLMATQVISRIQADLNLKVALRYVFEAPTIASLAALIEANTFSSAGLDTPSETDDTVELVPVSRDQRLPVSFAQQRLWFLDQLEESSEAYILSRSMRLSNDCSVTVLKRAIARILNRHEVLRTTIPTVEGDPVQVIAPELASEDEVDLPIVDLRSHSIKSAQEELKTLRQQITQQPFNLAEDTLIRFQLVQLPDDSTRLLIAIHHIITDGWSMGILARELRMAYQDLADPDAHPDTEGASAASFAPLTIQYADFAYWQRQWLQGKELTRQLGYWQKQLAGAPPLLSLPTDFPRPEVQSFKGGTHAFRLDDELAQQLIELSQRSGTTLFMTLLSAFSVFLYRYADASDIVVGSPIANRNHKAIEPLIGFFANTLLLRAKIKDNPKFSELLKQVRRTSLDAYAHQDMPFEKLVEVLRPERSRSYNPLFQVMFVLHNRAAQQKMAEPSEENSSQPKSVIRAGGAKRATAKFDLNLSIMETRRGLRGSWTYSTDLFTPETIVTITGQFKALLADIVQRPDAEVDSLSILSAEQRRQMLLEQQMQKKIAGLSPAKRALLEKKLKKQKGRSQKATAPKQPAPAKRTAETALSFSQQNIWLLDQLNPGNPGYNRPTHLLFSGPLNVEALEQSLTHLVRRHEILRTCFTTAADGQPVQVVSPEALVKPIPVEDLSELSAAEQKTIVQEQAISQAHAHFDLRSLPLFKTQLLKLNSEKHLLLITFHHIVFDGWSTSILLKDLGALYEASVNGATPELPALSTQYADFALWQQQQLKTATMATQLAYWKNRLSGQLPILELPTDRPRTASQTTTGGEYALTLPEGLKQQLSAIAKQQNATLFMVLLAGFKTLLYRYTNEEDIIVGSPVAGRNSVETEQLIGLFANTLVLRTGLQGDQSFQSLVLQVRETALGAFAHQGVPLPKLVEALQVDRDLSRSTLFQILFQFKNLPDQTVEAQNVRIQDYTLKTNIASLDLALEIKEQTKGLSCLFKYDASLFDASTIHRMGDHFLTLLQSAVADASQSLSQLSVLPAAERSQIVQWQTSTDVLPAQAASIDCIHEVFEQQVAQNSEVIALAYQDEQLTYHELNALANQLARKLRKSGVQADTPVGIYLKRSPQLLIAVLAILKAGGAYVPLDADALPTDRVNYVLQDTQAPVLITNASLIPQLSINSEATVLALDTQWNDIANEESTNLSSITSSHHLAYLIYTSGSTGQPKGTMVQHGGLVDAFYSWNQSYNLPKLQHHLQLAGFSFDVFTGDWVRALCSGARLVLCPSELKLEPVKLYQLMKKEQIDCAEFVPGIIRILVQHLMATEQSLEFMKLLIVGSDTWYMREYRQLQTFCGENTRLVNSYGLTEDTIDSTFFEYDSSPSAETQFADEALVPIGRPFATKQLLILDDQLQPSPIGIPGQLYISSRGLARGYLNREELTAERFISLPSSLFSSELFPSENATEQQCRVYRTGDRARFLPDGNVEFLGRLDFQVKIRGSRIELGEIEVALLKLSTVQETVVVAQADNTGNQRLVAYIVLSETAQSSAETSHNWRGDLQQQLPDYMVPSAFVILEAFPLTPSGKVDRKKLPSPDFSQLSLGSEYRPPTTLTEQTLATLWGEILNIESVGVDDNFFELGGHSLLATQLMARIRTETSTEVPLRVLFEAPTVATLSVAIDHLVTNQTENPIPAIVPVDHSEPQPLSSAQKRLWIINQLQGNNTAYNMRKAVQLKGELNVPVLVKSLNEIIRRHGSLRTTFDMSGDGLVQIVHPPVPLDISVTELESVSQSDRDQELRQKVSDAGKRIFDLGTGPLFHIEIIKRSEDLHILTINIHHIVFDGWSFGIFFREMSALYNAFIANEPSPLSPLPIQYVDFSHWQNEWQKTETYQQQLSYWTQHLADALPVLDLPTDYPRPAVQTFNGAMHSQRLPLALKEQLLDLGQAEGATLFMTMLSAFKLLCYRLTNQEKITVGSPIAGRTQSEVEKLIGFFLSNLVLHSDLSGGLSCQELLQQVKQNALDAYANQAVPFEALLDELQPPRDLSRTPLFQVWFNMVNLKETKIGLEGIESKSFKSSKKISAKFDITLYVSERADGLSIRWVYNTSLFRARTIEYMGHCFEAILRGMVAEPTQKIATLPLPTAERNARKNTWQDASELLKQENFKPFEKADIEQSIAARFAEQVRQYSDRTAIKTTRHEWTYQTLDQQANRVANGILAQASSREQAIQQTQQVALLFEHDAPMIAGLVGVLKLGRAYVALDPQYPTERLKYILKDSQASVILANDQTFDVAQALAREGIVVINTDMLPAQYSAPNVEVSPDAIAYILYTSGSTGKPKGVVQNHRNVLHFIRVYTNNLYINEQDKLTLLSSYSFDAAVMDIFGALLNGATLYPIDVKKQGLSYLSRCLREENITVYHSTPTLYRYFLEDVSHSQSVDFSTVRTVVLGGEAVNKRDVDLFKQYFSTETVFINGLGPSESTVTLQQYITHDTPIQSNNVSVGYPVEDTEVLLLNDQDENVLTYGEIAIRSEYVALGYWQQDALTEQAFSHNVADGKKRTYKTGDLGRVREDGSIEFLGRKDFQIKLRGFRIEPGEIESALTQHPTIEKAVVMGREDALGTQQLVAYVVPSTATMPDIAELKQFVASLLPDYMVPSAFVMLKTLPLTPSGKVDRLSLPTPERPETAQDIPFVAPRTDIEEALASMWCDLLNLPQVSTLASFFDLGGHSLLAVQLFSTIEKNFGKKLPLSTLFQTTTIEGLAAILDQEDWSAPWESLVAIKPQGTQPPLFYIHAGGGNLLVYRDLALSLGKNQPVYGLQPRGLDGSLLPSSNIKEMATFYIEQIKTLQPNGPYHLAGLSSGGLIAWEMAQQLQQQQDTVGLLAMFDTSGPGYPTLLPIAPRITSVVSWFVSDSLQRIKRGLPQLVDGIQQQGFVAAWRQVLAKLNLTKLDGIEPVQKELPSTSSANSVGSALPSDDKSNHKSSGKSKHLTRPNSQNKQPPKDDQTVIKELLTNRYNRSIAQYKAQNKAQNAGKISWEVRVNLFLAQLLRRSSQSYYANYFTKGLFRPVKPAKLQNAPTLPAELRQVRAANRKAKKQYVPQAYPGKAVLFRATESAPGIAPDPELGWHDMAEQGLEVYNISGTHSSMIDSPMLSQQLKQCLQQAQAAQAGDVPNLRQDESCE